MASVQLRNAIICDRIYQDDFELACMNRIYPGKIILSTVPSVFQLYVYCAFSVETDKPVRLEFKLEGPKVKAAGGGELEESSDHFEIMAPFFTYLDSPSELTFKWRLDEGRWSKAIKWAVEIREDADYLEGNDIDTLKTFFNARGRVSRLLDKAIARTIE